MVYPKRRKIYLALCEKSKNYNPHADTRDKIEFDTEKAVEFHAESGLFCGEWLSFGGPDLPGDQRMANAVDLTWTAGPLKVREMEAKKTLPARKWILFYCYFPFTPRPGSPRNLWLSHICLRWKFHGGIVPKSRRGETLRRVSERAVETHFIWSNQSR